MAFINSFLRSSTFSAAVHELAMLVGSQGIVARGDSNHTIERLTQIEDRATHVVTVHIDTDDGASITYGYGNQNCSTADLDAIISGAQSMGLTDAIDALFSGDLVNTTERRPALHMALRAQPDDTIARSYRDGSFLSSVMKERERMFRFVRDVQVGAVRSGRNVQFTDVVSIGIGGSYLGPEMVCQALTKCQNGLNVHFIANVDPVEADRVLAALNPSTTLVVAVSKTFTTAETLANLQLVKNWMLRSLEDGEIEKHLVAVTAAPEDAKTHGFEESRIFAFDEAIGGRYSLWSAVGMPIALYAGVAAFQSLLAGGRSMDKHFTSGVAGKNIPVLMAAYRYWNAVGLGYATHAVLPYCTPLARLPAYLQQLMMESTGKGVRHDGVACTVETGQAVFGEPGTNSQHSFMQMLHQGRATPVDFIAFSRSTCDHKALDSASAQSSHRDLLANMIAQMRALAFGYTDSNDVTRRCPGNRPSSFFLLDQGVNRAAGASPECLGALIAAYEHSVFVEAFLYGINPFDQGGVQAGKVMANEVRPLLNDGAALAEPGLSLDPVSRAILNAVNRA